MSGIAKSVCALLCVAATLLAPLARADVAPASVTCYTLGAACDNAAPNGFGAGVCTTGAISMVFGRCGPAGDAGAGQTACLFCEAAQGGTGGSGTAGASNAAGATSSAGAASANPSDGDSGGCSVRALGTERGIATVMLGLGLAALALGRRRR